MKKIQLNNTNLQTSQICLGTSNYGTSFPEMKALRQLDKFCEMGGNFIDSAHVYGDWIPGETGRSEKIIGKWLNETGFRNKVIIATKGGHPNLESMNIHRVHPSYLEEDLEGSLENLKTNYIDIYFLHRDDLSIHVATIIDYLEEKVRQGKIRYYGCSNWSLSRIIEAQNYAEENLYKGFVCNQIMGCLEDVNREYLMSRQMVALDKEFKRYHNETKMNLMSYMTISGGYFSKRIDGKRLSQDMIDMYDNSSNDKILEELRNMCRDGKYNINDFCFKYVTKQKFPSIAIASFSNDEQLEQGMKCCELEIDSELINSISKYKKLQGKI